MQLKSQKMRKLAPELDPLRIGTGWTKEDLGKVQVIVESTYGDSHPGSGHLNILEEEVRKGIAEEGGFGARYHCTDICDGESQGTDGINYSLASREMIANMIEIHANATPFDAGVYLSSCDKGVPGNLIGLARVDIPSVFVPGGTMNAGPEMLTLEQLGMYSAKFERGEIDEEKLDWAKCNACRAARCMFFYRNSFYDADHGRGAWSCTSGNSTDAGNQPGSPCICKRGWKTGGKTGKDGTYASFRYCDDGKL